MIVSSMIRNSGTHKSGKCAWIDQATFKVGIPLTSTFLSACHVS
jgi:hypothetical protein